MPCLFFSQKLVLTLIEILTVIMADSPNVSFQKDKKTLTTKTTVCTCTICDFKKS